MAYIELYSDEILDTISLGKTEGEFNPNQGDYVKVEILNIEENAQSVIATFYSNKLLLKNPNTNQFYIGDYHFHSQNGFMVGKEHTTEQHSTLLPIPVGTTEPQLLSDFNPNLIYQKQLNVYYDDKNKIYIKPTELLEKLNSPQSRYKLNIYFLRSLKTTIGKFLKSHENNLIENGNFFAGLEATQTGDLDRSLGHNRFTMLQNPGVGRFVLEQNGAGNNKYDMKVTGIESDSNYILSAWVGFNNKFDPNFYDILSTFGNASSLDNILEGDEEPNTGNNTTMSFELQGRYYNGWPHCRLTINGAPIADFNVEGNYNDDVMSGRQMYEFNLPSMFNNIQDWENTEIEIGVQFDNDSYGGEGSNQDRNLYFYSFVAPSGRKFDIVAAGENYLTENGVSVSDTSVLYHKLNGTIFDTSVYDGYNFPGEFRVTMAWNGQIRVKMKASDFFDYTVSPPETPSITGLSLFPQSDNYITDMFSSYKLNQNNNLDRNLKIITVGDITWYKRFKLLSTTPEANLGSLNIFLGNNHTENQIASNTLGRRYFTDLRFEKIENLNNALDLYISNLINE